jgi:transposase
MAPHEPPSVVRCHNCGATMEVPSSHLDDGHESLEGRTARCPKCGYVNVADSSAAMSAVSVKDQQMVRRV